ncbi:MAG: Elongation factor 4, partial [Candidatus Moranbacteria bacterium GW2011_GWF1_36_4]
QGIQAQTIAHTYKALEQNLVVIPVLNKIDRPEAQVEKVRADLASFLKIDESEVLSISAKTGQNCEALLKTVIDKIPAPKSAGADSTVTQALIFDSYYDLHKGVIAFVRVFSGKIENGSITNLGNIPIKTQVYCIESRPGNGGVFIKSAGNSATVSRIVGEEVFVLMPSKKEKKLLIRRWRSWIGERTFWRKKRKKLKQ